MEQSKTIDASGGGDLIARARLAAAAENTMYGGSAGELYNALADALASAPHAPTPDAGSDLAKLSANATKGPWTLRDKCILGPSTNPHIPSPDVVASSAYSDRSLQDDAANLRFLFALAEAYRSGRLVEASASPPPGEDLAEQGEPEVRVAMNTDAERRIAHLEASLPFDVSKWLTMICAHVLGLYDASEDPNVRDLGVAIKACAADLGEAVAARLAPAPSRPEDREEIALKAASLRAEAKALEAVGSYTSADQAVACAEAYEDALALRDAPRNGGDGWRPIETAPMHGDEFLAGRPDGFQQVVFWDESCEVHGWGTKDSDAICPADFFSHWRPLPAPPSPNAGDGTQDTQGGGR